MLHLARLVRRRPATAIRQLLTNEAAGGYVLIAAAAAALVVANSPLADGYFAVLHLKLGPLSLQHWINDGLMALFFLLVGLEIKRELIDGEMSSWPRRILPGAGALGGMIVPALVYLLINRDHPANLNGWAIPAATDIAFALGVLALLGKRVPASLKLLLTAIAIIDDLGAILIIALAYTDNLQLAPLGAALAGLALLVACNRLGVMRLWPYLLIGAAIWCAVLLSGVHATLAGVAVAFTIPLRRTVATPEDAESPLVRLEHALSPLSAFLIVPVFGFANAGVDLRGETLAAALAPVPLGVALGLLIGKPLGVLGAVWVLVRMRVVDLPAHASWRQLAGVAILCGIGFTMSLFIAALAFDEGSPEHLGAKLGILVGSGVAAALGYLVLALKPRPAQP